MYTNKSISQFANLQAGGGQSLFKPPVYNPPPPPVQNSSQPASQGAWHGADEPFFVNPPEIKFVKPEEELDLTPEDEELGLTPELERKRLEEFRLLKEAYATIKGDTWETAIGLDTIGQQNLQEFKERWEDILTGKEYKSYEYSKDYGSFAPPGFEMFDKPTLISSAGSGYIGG